MSAVATIPRRSRASITPLRIVLAAGGWANALIVLGTGLGILLPALTGFDPTGGVVLASILTSFWAMLAGMRLIALFLTSARLRAPHLPGRALVCGLTALVLAVLLPAMALAMTTSVGFAMAAAVLATGLALGLFLTSMPPWTLWPLLAIGAGAHWLPRVPDSALPEPSMLAGWISLFALSVLGLCALCWAWMASRNHRQEDLKPWSTPMAMAMARSNLDLFGQAQQAGWNSLLTPQTPVGNALQRTPQQALGIALGPGFGRNSLRNVLVAQAPNVAVSLFWLLGTDPGSQPHIGLTLAPFMVISVALIPMARLQTLFWRPAQGLHELALLPGLPQQPALAWAIAGLLGWQTIVRSLPALAVMAGFGLVVDAPHAYYPMLAWACAGGLLLLTGATLLSLRSKAGRWASMALCGLILLCMMATMIATTMRGGPPAWLQAAWGIVLLAGVLLHASALVRLRALPHPWLQN